MRRRGLSLIELLVVVAVLALILGVMIVYYMNGDDRRCRLEAERLAAFLHGAAAEAVMSDGPLRVAVGIEAQRCDRELAELSAETDGSLWGKDPRADSHGIHAPVRMTTLQTAVGERTDGVGWILFRGRRTPGGVVVLELKEAVYSVLVPPGGDKPVRVERGRFALPDPPAPLLSGRKPSKPLPSFEFGVGGSVGFDGGGKPAASADGGVAAAGSRDARPRPDSAGFPADQGVADSVVVDAARDAASPLALDVGSADALPEAADGGDKPDANSELTCQTDQECPTPWGYCARDLRCGFYPPTQTAYVIGQIQVAEPAALKTVMADEMNDQIVSGLLNMVLLFPNRDREDLRSRSHNWGHPTNFVFARRTAGGFVAHEVLPAFTVRLPAIGLCGEGCVQFHKTAAPPGEPQPQYGFGTQMELYVWVDDPLADCQYRRLTVKTDFALAVNLAGGSPEEWPAVLTLQGAIEQSDARQVMVRLGSQRVTLEELLRDANVQPSRRTFNTNVDNAYAFDWVGNARKATYVLGPDLNLALNRPPPCTGP